MESLQVYEGVELCINGDEKRVIRFDPSDLLFAEKFYKAFADIRGAMADYQRRAAELEKDKTKDSDGFPLNMGERLEFVKSTCTQIYGVIDSVFGEGTSQTVFGDTFSLNAIDSFVRGVSVYFQPARTEKMNPYMPPDRIKRGKPRKRK